jgi:hypothetical protein
MKNLISILMVCSMVYFISCRSLIENYRPWLDSMKGKPTINVEGVYESDEWGQAVLIQKDNVITGTIGSYDIQGSVNDKTIYLVIGSSGSYYFVAILEPYKNLIMGRYGTYIPRNKQFSGRSYPLTLKKTMEIK